MFLHELKSPRGSRTKKVRKGRGPGSGQGKTAARGNNGQRSRSGRGIIMGSEGGQMPLIRRLPKVGFNTLNPVVYQIVHLDALNRFDAGTVVSLDVLKKAKLLASNRKPFKVLARGELKKALTVQAHAFSTSAAEQIQKSGGKADVIQVKKDKIVARKAK